MSLDAYSKAANDAADELIAAGRDISRKYGLTGFMAGWIFWRFAREWLAYEGPARLIRYEDALYPQHERHFRPTMRKETLAWLREEARNLLAKHADSRPVHPNVLAHWRRLAAGEKPWPFIEEEEIR